MALVALASLAIVYKVTSTFPKCPSVPAILTAGAVLSREPSAVKLHIARGLTALIMCTPLAKRAGVITPSGNLVAALGALCYDGH